MNDYLYVFFTWDREDLLEKAIASVQEDELYAVIYVKHFNSLAAAMNYVLTWYGRDYKSLIMCNDDIELSPYAGKYLHEARLKKNVVMTTAYGQGLPAMYCFCVGKDFVEKVGYFDEQFKRAWFEDTDILHRMELLGLEVIGAAPVYHAGTDKFDKENIEERDTAYWANAARYEKKWGGPMGHERFSTPYEE